MEVASEYSLFTAYYLLKKQRQRSERSEGYYLLLTTYNVLHYLLLTTSYKDSVNAARGARNATRGICKQCIASSKK